MTSGRFHDSHNSVTLLELRLLRAALSNSADQTAPFWGLPLPAPLRPQLAVVTAKQEPPE
jgi:hypothetical protein